MHASVSVQEADFDVGAEIAALSAGRDDVGAVASFVGLVRADKVATQACAGDQVPQGFPSVIGAGDTAPAIASMTLEHYPGMTEKALAEIAAEALGRWPLMAVRVIHRVGCLRPGERIVFVGIGSAHRGAAFAACEFIMDYLKTRAPFWKKEQGAAPGDEARWVDAREADDSAAARWQR